MNRQRKTAYSGGSQHMRGFFDQIDAMGKDLDTLKKAIDGLGKSIEKLDGKLDREVSKIKNKLK
jgi:hypothetical protein